MHFQISISEGPEVSPSEQLMELQRGKFMFSDSPPLWAEYTLPVLSLSAFLRPGASSEWYVAIRAGVWVKRADGAADVRAVRQQTAAWREGFTVCRRWTPWNTPQQACCRGNQVLRGLRHTRGKRECTAVHLIAVNGAQVWTTAHGCLLCLGEKKRRDMDFTSMDIFIFIITVGWQHNRQDEDWGHNVFPPPTLWQINLTHK